MPLAKAILDGLERRLHAHAGLDLPSWVVESRALARMSALALGPQEYLDLVSAPRGAAELSALVEAVRVGETRFFRHRPQVDALLEVVIPAWRSRDERRPRVWSAGCATGEEAYTLALVLGRALPAPRHTVSILATDVSAEALSVARRAAYPARAAEEVPEPWRAGLIEEAGHVRVRPEVAKLVSFERQNLADAVSPRGFDLVWCRNVLIYFGPEARRRVVAKLVAALKPGGFLFVGYSETLRDAAGLRSIRHGDQVLWQKPSAGATEEPGGNRISGLPAEPRNRISGLPAEPGSRSSGLPAEPRNRISSLPAEPGGRISGLPAEPGGRAPLPARAPRQSAERPPVRGRVDRRISASDPAALAGEIRSALAAPGPGTLTIDLDAAEYLDDAVAPVLRRAMRAAESAGIDLVLVATRPGPQRWLRRNGLAGGGG